MKMNLALTALALTAFSSGCTVRAQGELDTTEQMLVADEQESTESDDSLEAGVDEPLSGADVVKAAEPGDALDERGRLENVRLRAPKHFLPAGCLTSSVSGLVVTHVFNNCTGPRGLRTFNGTIVSTWSFQSGQAKVVHAATDFSINGAVFSGSRTVTYSKAGSVYTKSRVGDWTGKTAGGKDIRHQADFVTSYDASTDCMVRNGQASSAIANREFSRKVEGLKRCGIQYRGCPDAGKLTLSRNGKSIEIDFLGGRSAEVTRPDGSVVSRQLACVE